MLKDFHNVNVLAQKIDTKHLCKLQRPKQGCDEKSNNIQQQKK